MNALAALMIASGLLLLVWLYGPVSAMQDSDVALPAGPENARTT